MKDIISKAMTLLVRRRWDRTTPEQRHEIGKQLAAKRWAGHVKKAKKPKETENGS